MKKYSFILTSILLMCLGMNCSPKRTGRPTLHAADITKVIKTMSAQMVHDVTNPPLAARFFAYSCMSGYEVLSQNDVSIMKLSTALNGYPQVKKPLVTNYDAQLAALFAITKTAAKMQPSGAAIKVFEQRLIDSCLQIGFAQDKIDSSLKYAQQVSAQIIGYAVKDNYNRISNFKRYVPKDTAGAWYPTPPAYMGAVEPYFATVRPFTLQACNQFNPAPPVPFSTDKKSGFYKLMLECQRYDADSLSAGQRAIAGFWDCNPFAVQDNGHMLIGLKKISPGAHWMLITGIACKQANLGFDKAMAIHAMVAIGLMDSFISCWYQKYQTNRIRPETAIHQYLNPRWKSFLQTPPFPEYLSGHSCISSTSAVILESYFGTSFNYTDDVELAFGIKPRKFGSFSQAAAEAGYSRLLGGIHFEDGIANGKLQGEKIGRWVLHKFNRIVKEEIK